MFALTVSRTDPKNIKEVMADHAWMEAMQEEFYQFEQLDVWELVDRPLCKNVINMKWLWKNKRDEENTVIRRSVLQSTRRICRSTSSSQSLSSQEGIIWTQASSKSVHDMTSCDGIGTPMATKPLDVDLSGTPIDQTKYHSMAGALTYLTSSRPDNVHATCYCACYQARPTEKHLKEVKRIFGSLRIPFTWDSDI
ncbi:hypothetical protein Tco_0321271 [Tanacetum coccineum]